MFKNKATLSAQLKKIKFHPYLGNATRYGPAIFNSLVSPRKLTNCSRSFSKKFNNKKSAAVMG